MTDLANVSALTRTPAQLPIEWYFDPQIAEIERKMLFENGPGYVGHELMVPEVGNYRSLTGCIMQKFSCEATVVLNCFQTFAATVNPSCSRAADTLTTLCVH